MHAPTLPKLSRKSFAFTGIALLLLSLAACSSMRQPIGETAAPAAVTGIFASPSGYHALFLDNGLLVYGKAEGLGTKFVTLKDVHYIRNEQDPVTKSVVPRIMRRGSEFHRPDSMVINWDRVILVESVGADSDVIKMIKGQTPAKP